MNQRPVQTCSGVTGLVELPNEVGRWLVPSINVNIVDGLLVPVHHLALYKRIIERHGYLVSGPILEAPQTLLAIMSQTLDMIVEIESVRVTKLSRERVDDWLAKLRFANMIGFSVGWLTSLVDELDRTLRRSQFVVEARTMASELDPSRELEEVMSKLQCL